MRKAVIAGAVLLWLAAVGMAQPALSVKAIAAGEEHSLALASDGTVWEWGASLPGQAFGAAVVLGNAQGRAAPTRVSSLSGVVAIAGGMNYSLAVKYDGTLWAWGYNSGGQLGDGTTTHRPMPVQVSGLAGVVAAAGGWDGFQSAHSLAVKDDGTVWAWGVNDSGQLGDGTATGDQVRPGRMTPARVSGLTGVVAVAASWCRSLALKSDGTVWVGGGQASSFQVPQLTPVQVSGLAGVVAIATSDSGNLALKGDGTVWAWGWNRSTPTQVEGLGEVMAIATGGYRSLAVKRDGTVWAWEGNEYGTTPRSAPVQLPDLAGAAAVAAGGSHYLALKGDGTVWTWGYNSSGQLGDGTMPQRLAPAQVSGLAEVASVSAGGYHSLALRRDGTVWAWGQAGDVMVPVSQWEPGQSVPAPVNGLAGVVAVAAGERHSLALKDDGTVWAWGSNESGQLGDETTTDRSTPVRAIGLTGVAAIAAGANQSLAVRDDGTVWEWGVNPNTGLDSPPFVIRSTSAQVGGLTGVVAVATGYGTLNLALKDDGTVWFWGWLSIYPTSPPGPPTRLPTPAQVSGLSGVVAIAGPSLALKSDGTLWSLGDIYHWTGPVQVSGAGGIAAVAAGGLDEGWVSPSHTLALKNDGTVWAWGDNWDGQLGDGTTAYERPAPVQVGALSEVAAIAAGGTHSLAVKRDGTVWAWGGNYTGQLGDGRTASRPAPVHVVPLGSPDLAMGMSHDGDFMVGGQGIYTLTIGNTGLTATAGTITVTDILPPGLTFFSATGNGWTCAVAGRVVTCTNPGPIAPGASSIVTLTVRVEPQAYPGVTNIATVSNASDFSAWNNTTGDPAVVVQGR